MKYRGNIMARTGITYLEVTAAIDKMIANGEEPTIMGIREILGTGSPNTIHRHLSEWRDAQPKEQIKPVVLPPAIADALTQELERQAAVAREKISADLQRAVDSANYLSKTGEANEAEIEELREKLEAKDTEITNLKADFDRQTDALSRAQHDLEAERKVTHEQRDELALSRNRVLTLTDQVTDLKAEITSLKDDLKTANATLIEVEKTGAVAAAQLASEQQKTADLVSRLNTANEAISALKADHKSEIEAMRNEAKQARNEMIKVHASLEVARDKAAAEAKKLNDQIALEHRKNAELQSEIDSLTDKLTAQSKAKK